eukprot:TRINITY_DN68055_c2_g1_i1.p1 TRINITY_DN68055_c2_g1~~TRINITY_DN68055_c2_g1_i1.p1  ORF type:complete len:261 (-),score=1.06 TRINITY_DN68055_c2_g1_i1:342-1124(-)
MSYGYVGGPGLFQHPFGATPQLQPTHNSMSGMHQFSSQPQPIPNTGSYNAVPSPQINPVTSSDSTVTAVSAFQREREVVSHLMYLIENSKHQEAQEVMELLSVLLSHNSPLYINTACLVKEEPAGFGMFSERSTSVYQPGENLIIYVEPKAHYIHFDTTMQHYRSLLTLDVTVLDSQTRHVITHHPDFSRFEFTSRRPTLQVHACIQLALQGLGQGDYLLKIVLRDLQKPIDHNQQLTLTSAESMIPFSIKPKRSKTIHI